MVLLSISKHFSGLEDPRVERTKRHLLMDIIGLTVCAVIGGCNSWVEVELFGKSKYKFLKKYLNLPNGIPSHDTIGRVFAALDPQTFERCFISWTRTLVDDIKNVIAIDGKSVCGSRQGILGKKAIHMVSAFSCAHRLVLGQIKTDEKSNEITAIPELLNVINIKGSIITIDAMGCQKAIAKQIVSGGGDYIFGLKGNQGNLHKEVQKIFDEAQTKEFRGYKYSFYETSEKAHGREEVRRYWTIEKRPIAADIAIFFGKEPWEGLQVIGMVESERKVGDKKSKERRYYISSMENNAEEFARAVRGHWRIENSLHWVLDVIFREDHSQVRVKNAAENFSIIRRIALNMIKNEKTFKGSINSRRLKAGWDNDYLVKILCS
ncbi:MAG: ISAs1 family transposase [Candidatus Omnitrophica bacterium]|nr:ISAs1 family transposase [Candidatus Omnitrophota bacterium]